MEVRADIVVEGLVQGVGYRYFVARHAERYHLSGLVRNQPDGSVRVVVEGDRSSVENLVSDLKVGPRSAQVRDLRLTWDTPRHDLHGFEIQ
ncbi:MAG TPA: acylphosphatase [Bacteroidota bacterium]|nr:acylphosphatase [Bacteroidota bacterium]